ncbi:hypothetical protein FIBSPDRAFT_933202 [Athelia psychrophila]|uniref:MYND-type domain-containing protein n=1 Tax=Athelia psychrophila TaxID=1759441 RepID=A0A166HEU8_9AGAM|nr:hypothetical protein FIBSPDRAFT_933202 [Fibularhizoctonia sp. CBS 109695]
MDQIREDLFAQLTALDVDLPRGTKMTNVALDKRLGQALDASQTINEVLVSASLEPSTLEPWSLARDLVGAVQRTNLQEAAQNQATKLSGTTAMQGNIFMEVRQCILAFATHAEQGHNMFLLKDEAQESGCIIRVDQVLTVDEGCPVFVVYYKEIRKSSTRSVQEVYGDIVGTRILAVGTKTTRLERAMLVKLMEINSKRISADYQPKTRPQWEDSTFRLSFILPLGAINPRDLGKLTRNDGCAHCGDAKALSRCAGCQAVQYCSKECQKQDWKWHKSSCRSLKDGHWRHFKFVLSPVPGKYLTNISLRDTLASIKSASDRVVAPGDNTPPPDIHGDKLFMVKVQELVNSGPPNVYIYDRQRSFQVYMLESGEPEAFGEAMKAMKAPHPMAVKMYRWAKRVGDFELSVCFDRQPETIPLW